MADEDDPSALCQEHGTRAYLRFLVLRDVVRQVGTEDTARKNEPTTLRYTPIIKMVVIDFFFGQLIIGPLITTCWRAAWIGFKILLDEHVFHNTKWPSILICVSTGVLAGNALNALSHRMRAWASRLQGIRFLFLTRLFTLLSFSCTIILWKGWWDVCELEGNTVAVGVAMFGFGGVLLNSLGYSRNLVGFPLMLSIDVDDASYISTGIYHLDKTPASSPFIICFVNCFMTSFVEVLTISCWYGVWIVEDRLTERWFQIQGSGAISAILALCIGQSSAFVAFIVQFCCLLVIYPKSPAVLKRHWAHSLGNRLLAFIGLFSAVSNLRGVWYLLNIFVFPDHPYVTLIASFSFASSMLLALKCASSLHGGITRDPKVHEWTSMFLMNGFYFTSFVCRGIPKASFEADPKAMHEDPLEIVSLTHSVSDVSRKKISSSEISNGKPLLRTGSALVD